MWPSVEYLGYLVDAAGIYPLPSKQEAIVNAQAPVTVQQLQAIPSIILYLWLICAEPAKLAEC